MIQLYANPQLLPHERAFLTANLATHTGLSPDQYRVDYQDYPGGDMLLWCNQVLPGDRIWFTWHPRDVFLDPGAKMQPFLFALHQLGGIIYRDFIQHAVDLFSTNPQSQWDTVLDGQIQHLTERQQNDARCKFVCRVLAQAHGKTASIDQSPDQLLLGGFTL